MTISHTYPLGLNGADLSKRTLIGIRLLVFSIFLDTVIGPDWPYDPTQDNDIHAQNPCSTVETDKLVSLDGNSGLYKLI